MKKLWKKVVASLVIGVLTVGAAGCAKGETASSGSTEVVTEDNVLSEQVDSTKEENNTDATTEANETIHLRFGATGWKLYESLLQAAGLDDFEGYEVEYFVFQGGNLCLEALAADQIDFTTTSEIPPIAASKSAGGGNFKIVLIGSSSPQNQEVVALETSGIKTIADLKGKKVGYIKNTTAHYFLNEMLKKEGLSWNDIEPVEITTADGVTALIGGEIAAFASYGNSINAAKANGAITIETAVNILSGNFPLEISETALQDEAKTEAIADYFARVQKAYEWAGNNLEEWAKIQAEPTGNTEEESLDLLQRTYNDRGYYYNLIGIDDNVIASEQSVADALYELKVLDDKTDVSTFYDTSFYEKYQKALENLN
ncbi:ABC transporter substrate-binding protein [Konateibacter massiliensis]|uniref:ABC transporter substrate-binding protein n=1 Tax=Konateibacter massiliensis TaxID=2002841 RepID=UPI000C16253E|nr:ABC transporter substrate-binding protein [Konateibacter massiliensis]